MGDSEREQFEAALAAHQEWVAAGRPPGIPHAEARRLLLDGRTPEQIEAALADHREWLATGHLASVLNAEAREFLLADAARRYVTAEADDPRYAWRDDAEKREFIDRVTGYLVNGPPPPEQRISREEIRKRYGA